MSWPKEDRKMFNLSEVFKNMENKIIENYNKIELAQKTAKINELEQTLNSANIAGEKLNTTIKDINDQVNNTSDHEVLEQVSNDNVSVTVSKNSADDEEKIEEEEYFEQQIKELSAMAYDAGMSGNLKLAYKIERAVAEIKEAINEDK